MKKIAKQFGNLSTFRWRMAHVKCLKQSKTHPLHKKSDLCNMH